MRPAAPLAASPSRSSSNLMLLMFAIAIVLPLIAIATALPAGVLPQAVRRVLDRRREDVVVAGIVVPLSIGVGLLVVLVVR